MTVTELIELLKQANPNAKIVVSYIDDDCKYCENRFVDMVNDEGDSVVIGTNPV